MNDVILALDGFKNNKIYYGDTDSVYIHKNDYNMLIEKGLIGKKTYFNGKTIMVKTLESSMVCFWLQKLNTASLSMKMVF